MHQRRQIDAVRTQRHCVVFVYQDLGEPGSSPHSQTDSGSSSPCLFIIDQGDGCLPSGLRRGNFPPISLSVSLSFSPPVCSASQCTSSNIVLTSWQSSAICTSCQGSCCHGYWQAPRNKTSPWFCWEFFFLLCTPRPSLSSSLTDETPVKLLCCLYCVIYFVAFSLCRGAKAVCGCVHRVVVHFCLRSTYNSRKSGKSCFPLKACISIPVGTWGTL